MKTEALGKAGPGLSTHVVCYNIQRPAGAEEDELGTEREGRGERARRREGRLFVAGEDGRGVDRDL